MFVTNGLPVGLGARELPRRRLGVLSSPLHATPARFGRIVITPLPSSYRDLSFSDPPLLSGGRSCLYPWVGMA